MVFIHRATPEVMVATSAVSDTPNRHLGRLSALEMEPNFFDDGLRDGRLRHAKIGRVGNRLR